MSESEREGEPGARRADKGRRRDSDAVDTEARPRFEPDLRALCQFLQFYSFSSSVSPTRPAPASSQTSGRSSGPAFIIYRQTFSRFGSLLVSSANKPEYTAPASSQTCGRSSGPAVLGNRRRAPQAAWGRGGGGGGAVEGEDVCVRAR